VDTEPQPVCRLTLNDVDKVQPREKEVTPSVLNRNCRVHSADALLMAGPICDGAGLFGGDGWKEQVWIVSFKSHRLGFVQREAQQALVVAESFAPLGEDCVFDLPDLGENLLARPEAEIGDCAGETASCCGLKSARRGRR
jgi:hypothetical protein